MKYMKEKLAIKGHPTRGKEVIEILEMLGGENFLKHDGSYTKSYYYIDNNLICCYYGRPNSKSYTLEEFFEKFPYKVGDKVIAYIEGCLAQFTIQDMRWNHESNKVEYKICSSWLDTSLILPYKEETKTMEGVYAYNEINCEHQEFGDKVKIRLGNDYEIKVEDKITYIIKKQSNKYPKTYEECCKVLKIQTDGGIALVGKWCMEDDYIPQHLEILRTFSKLLICRDAYWKIAGNWEPTWSCNDNCKYGICVERNHTMRCTRLKSNTILIFPTEEMRDVFNDNFKDLIEECKELL